MSTELKRPKKGEKRRGKIWAETQGRCVYCNSSPPAEARTVDHLWVSETAPQSIAVSQSKRGNFYFSFTKPLMEGKKFNRIVIAKTA